MVIWSIPILPALGCAVLVLFGRWLPRKAGGVIGCSAVGLALLLVGLVDASFLQAPAAPAGQRVTLLPWIALDGLQVSFGFWLDALSLVMVNVVAFVGFLIHLYSYTYMSEEDGYLRFFAYMNLFVAFMLTLVLADSLLLLFLAWEGVGLCSYLLIGFRYREPRNLAAAHKAFIVTRIGDAGLVVGLLVLFTTCGTFDLPELQRLAPARLSGGAALLAAALLLVGALGKSAQLPLQVWLPDAMAGPTPVSALIHAATMVTAGVYLVARTHAIFLQAPAVLAALAVLGAATALYAAACALAQRDVKRMLAYSTISQVGYMFLALGVGAWAAAIFHLAMHAVFKALLFLAAGVVVHALGGERDLRQMGGLRRGLPAAWYGFCAGAASLAALPLVTAGFYSKDAIVWGAWASVAGGTGLWLVALATAGLTALYVFRAAFLAFLGPAVQRPLHPLPGRGIPLVLATLAVLSLVAGVVGLPPLLGGDAWLLAFLDQALPPLATLPQRSTPGLVLGLTALSGLVPLAGLGLAWLLFRRERPAAPHPARPSTGSAAPAVDRLASLLRHGLGFDAAYALLLVRPYRAVARLVRADPLDVLLLLFARLAVWAGQALDRTQDGRLRRYALGLVLGAILAIAVLLGSCQVGPPC